VTSVYSSNTALMLPRLTDRDVGRDDIDVLDAALGDAHGAAMRELAERPPRERGAEARIAALFFADLRGTDE
jgi:hypothetical protein